MCAVLSGGMTALLLTPGTGICKPALVRRRDTNRRWRQVTKLPRPFPSVSPFYPAIRVFAVPPASAALPAPDNHPGVARTFDAIVLTGRERKGNHLLFSGPGPQVVSAIEWLMQDAALTY